LPQQAVREFRMHAAGGGMDPSDLPGELALPSVGNLKVEAFGGRIPGYLDRQVGAFFFGNSQRERQDPTGPEALNEARRKVGRDEGIGEFRDVAPNVLVEPGCE